MKLRMHTIILMRYCVLENISTFVLTIIMEVANITYPNITTPPSLPSLVSELIMKIAKPLTTKA